MTSSNFSRQCEVSYFPAKLLLFSSSSHFQHFFILPPPSPFPFLSPCAASVLAIFPSTGSNLGALRPNDDAFLFRLLFLCIPCFVTALAAIRLGDGQSKSRADFFTFSLGISPFADVSDAVFARAGSVGRRLPLPAAMFP